MGKRTRRGRNADVRGEGIDDWRHRRRNGGELRLMCALVAEVSGPAALFVESGFG